MSDHRIRRGLLAAAIAGTASLTLTAAPADAGGRGGGRDGCQNIEMCAIVEPGVDVHGTFATFTFTAHPDIKSVTIEVVDKNDGKDVVTATASPAGPGTWFPTMVSPLDTEDDYAWTIVGIDGTGAKYAKTGGFTTLSRTVVVSFDSIYVKDDSDETGAGEFVAAFNVGGYWSNPTWKVGDVDSGETVYPNHTVTSTHAGNKIGVGVYMEDDDSSPFNFCSSGYHVGGTGTDSCADWGTLRMFIPVTPMQPGLENMIKTVTIPTDFGGVDTNGLWFSPVVTVIVTHV